MMVRANVWDAAIPDCARTDIRMMRPLNVARQNPNIPYPGCDPASEFLTALHTCQPGSPPLGDSCGVVSVPLGYCRQPDGGGQPGGGEPCKGLDMYACFDQQGVCRWDRTTSQCIPVP